MRAIAAAVVVALAMPTFAQPGAKSPGGGGGAPPAERGGKAGKVDLRPRFKKGQEVRFKMVLESSQSDTGPEAPRSVQSTNQEIGLLLRCTSADPEGGSTLDLVYESLKVSMKSDLTTVSFDSTKPAKADDPADAALRSIVGLTLPVVMDKDGNISSVGSAEGAMGAVGALVGQFSGSDMIKSMFGPIFTSKKGAGEASVGESWTNEDTIEGAAGTIRLTLTHTLESHRDGKANIPMKGKATLTPTAAGGNGPKASIRNSSITGRTVWDTEAGMLQSMESRQHLEVETSSGGKPSATTQDMNVRVTRVGK